MFLQRKSYGFVVLKTFFLNQYAQNCGGEEKVNSGIFPFLGAKLVGGQPSYLSFR
jgi:hypothetical protein